MLKSICTSVGLIIVLALIPAGAVAQHSSQPGVGFAIISLASGQSVRVNALNLGTISSSADSSCSVTLQFIDANGQMLKETSATLRVGKATYLDLSRDQVPGNESRVPLRAVVLFGYAGGAPPTSMVLQTFDCNIVPSLELYNSDTKQTSVVLTNTKPLPGPSIRTP